jgi:hypothetical protein
MNAEIERSVEQNAIPNYVGPNTDNMALKK